MKRSLGASNGDLDEDEDEVITEKEGSEELKEVSGKEEISRWVSRGFLRVLWPRSGRVQGRRGDPGERGQSSVGGLAGHEVDAGSLVGGEDWVEVDGGGEPG